MVIILTSERNSSIFYWILKMLPWHCCLILIISNMKPLFFLLFITIQFQIELFLSLVSRMCTWTLFQLLFIFLITYWQVYYANTQVVKGMHLYSKNIWLALTLLNIILFYLPNFYHCGLCVAVDCLFRLFKFCRKIF